jgi:hypothetical protein
MPVTARLDTFLGWPLGDAIKYTVEEVANTKLVVEMRCILCSKHIETIKKHDSMKGAILKELEVFCSGTNNVNVKTQNRRFKQKFCLQYYFTIV